MTEVLRRLLAMLFGSKPKCNYVGPEVSRAIQRNEDANVKVRRELEALKDAPLTDTLRDIAARKKKK